MRKLLVPPATALYVGCDVFATNCVSTYCGNSKIVLVADAAIPELYAVDLASRLGAELVAIPSGEKAKSRDTAEFLVEELFKMGCGRDTVLVALGGGSTTDLVGFVASVYMRGLPLILIPTTLLAMVDAAIGGKTAIDTAHGKNLIGTLYPPKAIFVDYSLLGTLPEREWFNGLAEILKMGLIRDVAIWKLAQKNGRDPELILKAMEGKIGVVQEDPTEQGLRRILNFGHTIGHALEAVAQYEMPHGEAVALGCAAEAHLSMQLGFLAQKDFEQIEAVYSRFPLKLPRGYTREKLLAAMAHDKKKAQGKIRFVLIDRIGGAISFGGEYCRFVLESELEPTLSWMER